MKEMFKNFGKNFKEYISYLMKVGFKSNGFKTFFT